MFWARQGPPSWSFSARSLYTLVLRNVRCAGVVGLLVDDVGRVEKEGFIEPELEEICPSSLRGANGGGEGLTRACCGLTGSSLLGLFPGSTPKNKSVAPIGIVEEDFDPLRQSLFIVGVDINAASGCKSTDAHDPEGRISLLLMQRVRGGGERGSRAPQQREEDRPSRSLRGSLDGAIAAQVVVRGRRVRRGEKRG